MCAPGLCPDRELVKEDSAHAQPESYLRVPYVPSIEPPRSGAPRGLPRPVQGVSEDAQAVAIPGLGECPAESYRAIIAAATEYHMPLSIMFSVAYHENSRYDPQARVLSAAEDSNGLYMLNRRGGCGTGYSVSQLADPVFNARLAAWTMATRYVATGDWYEAIEPWSTRDLVFER